ncbi:glycerophosphodiester phosphodiesterase GDPDL4-like precursor [Nicotiana tabacum]|uniref:glycerophosphodiester phosphodiesterase n=1 Tax=Nicotiana tabacum TaxID=4097 RepID=Q2WGN6_TOBAC|nr:glycerophosphodiester phosphodiesterase GDPDL4-like precursor [Nicotiana tabacum]XP_009625976.1 glycerophosphodiester phosphodiesterase GDPDL4 [Nicotiana tomentosiformis]BAE53680.1 putative glycerophosphoryl diester phosphodiesterase family protein [Nicotiana tabacum]BAF34116.1 glycerophosphodiesterase-like protein [Nicotiana tabacum]
MWNLRSISCLLLLCCSAAFVSAQRSDNATSKWLTLTGDAPKVIARGGFSGLMPDSSFNAYILAKAISVADWVAWCDVQLTKDGVGICLSDIRLDNSSDVNVLFKNKQNTYLVNGVPQKGWFSVDFNFKDLALVSLKQGVFSRSPRFDGTPQQILTVQDVASQVKPPGLWLNIQHDSFYSQRNLSIRSFVVSLSRSVIVNYISSPEVNFLRSIARRFNPRVTKFVFRFLGEDGIEPSTNQTYGSLLKNLTFVKTFASGILVPKHYIWPVDNSLYLQPHTSVVLDAHKEGLEIFAADFANDVPSAYNYSYDPVAEYLSYIDNGDFSVDGVLSDFPLTPSSSVDCFSHLGKNDKPQVKLQIITSEGASGDYPGCTDLAYTKAASDGADVLGCPVQMTKDRVPFCLGSINLIDKTTAAQSPFSNIATTVPELKITNGILTINLTWTEIQSLKPAISNRWSEFRLFRNPKARNDGNFMSLADFLTFAKNATSVSGVMISVENAAYMAKQGLGVTGAVLDALSKAGYNNQTAKKVLIQSTDSSVLEEFKKSSYELVYGVGDDIRDIESSTILEIKTFAKSVIITKQSVFPSEDAFIIAQTNVVQKLQSSNLTVYVQLLNNEFVSQSWDFFSDSSVELNNYAVGAGIDGVITEYPATAARYRRNRCLGFKDSPPYMTSVQPGSLLELMAPQFLPPAEAPNPVLTESDVVEPPLPPVAKINPSNDNGSAIAPTPPNGQSSVVASILMSSVAILLATIMVV